MLLVNCEIEGGDILTVSIVVHRSSTNKESIGWIFMAIFDMQVLSLVLVGAFSLGGVLPQIGTFISASSSAAAVFDVIEEVANSAGGGI